MPEVCRNLCIFRESNSTLEYFSKSLITNFNQVKISLIRRHFVFLQASCKAFWADVSLYSRSKCPNQLGRLLKILVFHKFFLFFHINLCCLFFLANICQLLFVPFCDESCRFVAQEPFSMSLVQSCKELCILYGWWRVLFSVFRKCSYIRGCCNSWSSVFFPALCLFWCWAVIRGTYISSMIRRFFSLRRCCVFSVSLLFISKLFFLG